MNSQDVWKKLQEDAAIYIDDPGFWQAETLVDAIEAGISKREYVDATKRAAKTIRAQRKEEAKKKVIERQKERVEKSEYSGAPHMYRGDQAEIAELLMTSYADETGEPMAFEFGELHAYDASSGVWSPLDSTRLSERIQSWAGRSIVGDPGSDNVKVLHVNSTDTAIKLARHLPVRWGRGEGWLSDGRKGVAFANCFICAEPEHGRWRIKSFDKSPENRSRFGFEFPFDPDIDAPKFTKLIADLFEGAPDFKERERVVQEQAGAALLGVSPPFGRALVLYGPKGCGKSTLLDIIAAAFPANAVSAIQPQDWADGPMLSSLALSRLNVVNEVSVGDLSDANAVKRVVSGDKVTVAPKYKDPFTFRPDAGHIMTANTGQLPNVPNADPAFWDRWHVVPFENTFRGTDSEDRTLAPTIIEEELPGVLAWILQGAHRLLAQGKYTECPSGREVLKDWSGAANNVALFYSECTVQLEVVDSNRSLPLLSEIFEHYKAWAKNGNFRGCSQKTFSDRTDALGLRVRSNGTRCRCRLTDDFQDQLQAIESRNRRTLF